MSDIIRETERLHLVYASEIKKKQDKFDAAMKKLADEEKAINATDYVKEYVDTYRVSLSALEEIFADWDSVQRRTKGITFTVGEYIKRLSPRPVPKGGVFEYVDRLVEEGRAAIMEVDGSKTVEDDIAPQKRFCQCLTDLRYVVMSSRRLLAETGYEERKREEALAEVDKKKADLEFNFKKNIKFENLSCYKELEDLKAQILTDNEKANTMLIGKPLSDEETDYRFVIGFKKSNINKDALKFAVDVLGVPEKALSGVPVFFEPKTRNGVIVIRADRDYFEEDGGDAFDLIRKIYLSLLSSLGPKNLRLGGAETAVEAVIGAVADRVKAKLGENYIFDKDIASSPSGTISFNEALITLIRGRSKTYKGNDYKSIYEYNENTPDAKHDFVLAAYNYAPDCFGERFTSEQKKTFLNVLEMGPAKGVISLICIDKNSDFKLEDDKSKQISCDVIDVTENGVLYNGEPVSVDIMAENFKINDYLDYLSKENKASDSLSLKKLLEMSDKDFAVKPVEDYNDALRIPLGISSGVRYDYVLKTCSTNVFGLLVGMTGSGKSAFLHTFIMSAAYNYAPDELQMYLVDFKSGETSPAFANYKKGNPMYLPHVVYLSLRCREESAMDLLNKMDFMIDERAKIMSESKSGCSDIRAFNKSQAVLSGKYKKLPIALFIIDEYNNMFGSGTNFATISKLGNKLDSVLKRARSYGIEILFCGQTADPLIGCGATEQIGSKLSLKVNNPSIFNSYFKLNSIKAGEYSEKLKKIGTALISIGSSNGDITNLVKVAYAGETTSRDMKDIAERIREKYNDNPACKIVQAEAGNDDLFPISDYKAVAYKEGEYHLPIGASASNTIGVSLSFAEDRNASGYCALARESKLFELERSFTLSYIEKFNDGEFIYAAGPADGKEFVDGFGRENDFISKYVKICDDKEHLEIACELTKLKELLEKRREERSLDNKASFKPVYLVIHDVEWLLSGGTIGGKNATSAANKAADTPAKPVDTSATEKELAGSGVSLKGGALAMLSRVRTGGSTIQPKEEKPVEDNKTYYVSDLKAIVSDLYENGSGYCVFVILAHEKLSQLKAVCGEGENARSSQRYIYDSYDVLKAITENKSIEGARVDETCVYDNLSSTRTRLFDYSVEKNAEWWKALKAKRG